MVVGLLMVAYEDDILEEVLARHEEIVDVFYALDGTVPSTDSERIISASAKCAAYTRDADLRPTYGDTPRDGWRQHLYEQAVAEHGYENWFALLHGDEVWTFDPRDVVQEGVDGYVFPLPCYIPRDPWDYDRTPIEQLEWFLGPGWPEFRLFRGSPDVVFDSEQHFNVTPRGLSVVLRFDNPIRHYPYRSPESQRLRAAHGFDPDNYRHVREDDAVVWDEALLVRSRSHYLSEVSRSGSAPDPV